MIKKYKRPILLAILLITIILPISLVFRHSSNAKGFRNSPYRGSRTLTNERIVAGYCFTTDGNYNSYGTHDWIADSAVRLIMLNGDYRKYVSQWLFQSYSSADYAENAAPFKDWVDGKKSVGDHYAYFTNDQNNFPRMTDETYLKARRYVYFLHGTRYPDWDGKKVFSNNGHIKAEYVSDHTAAWIGNKGPGQHSFYFKYEKTGSYQGEDVGYFIPSDTEAADYALQAAGDAIYYLKFEKTVGEGEQAVTIKGKFESAALCLGGMAHYIADVAHPSHVTIPGNPFTSHIPWDFYVDKDTHFSITRFTNGGPDWSIIDPQGLASSIYPLNPWLATWSMAEMTYLAYDKDGDATNGDLSSGHPNAAINLKQDPAKDEAISGARAKELAMWAAFYTACAILWVSKRAKMDEREDTISDRTWAGRHPHKDRLTAPHKKAVPIEKIQKKPLWQKEEALAEHYVEGESMSMMLAIGVLAPVISLSVVPVLFVWTYKKVEE